MLSKNNKNYWTRCLLHIARLYSYMCALNSISTIIQEVSE